MPLLVPAGVRPNPLGAPVNVSGGPVTSSNILTIRDAFGGRTGSGQIVEVFDHANQPIFSIPTAGGPTVFGDHMRAGDSVFGPFISLDGSMSPASLQFPDGTRFFSGSGAPSIFNLPASYSSTVGDFFKRTDTPTVANQRLYMCTVAGSPGTWVGIA